MKWNRRKKHHGIAAFFTESHGNSRKVNRDVAELVGGCAEVGGQRGDAQLARLRQAGAGAECIMGSEETGR